MKTIKLFIVTTLLFTAVANAQITKGNWMVGGSTQFNHTKHTDKDNNIVLEGTLLSISPNLAYFIADKIAIGSILKYSFGHTNNSTSSSGYGIGPYLRYYFLKTDKPYNILSEANYQYIYYPVGKKFENQYGFKFGTVIFFNSSVGIEMLINYNKIYNNASNYKTDVIGFGIGMQIHLEK